MSRHKHAGDPEARQPLLTGHRLDARELDSDEGKDRQFVYLHTKIHKEVIPITPQYNTHTHKVIICVRIIYYCHFILFFTKVSGISPYFVQIQLPNIVLLLLYKLTNILHLFFLFRLFFNALSLYNKLCSWIGPPHGSCSYYSFFCFVLGNHLSLFHQPFKRIFLWCFKASTRFTLTDTVNWYWVAIHLVTWPIKM